MVRSLAYVFALDEIPCCDKYYEMRSHTGDAIQMLKKCKIKPSDVFDYMRVCNGDDIGIVDNRLLPDDGMVLGPRAGEMPD